MTVHFHQTHFPINIMNNDRIKASKLHAITRAKERYNLILTDEIYDFFLEEIKKSKPVSGGASKYDTRLYKVNYLKKNYIVVYNPVLDCLVTFLPKNRDNKAKRKKIKERKKHYGEYK